jgi:hypothetical protein
VGRWRPRARCSLIRGGGTSCGAMDAKDGGFRGSGPAVGLVEDGDVLLLLLQVRCCLSWWFAHVAAKL